MKTYFDTGSNSCYIYNRAIAEKVGVKYHSADTIILNNGDIRAFYGTIDSIELGNLTIKDVPVIVNIETIDAADSIQIKCDSVLNSMFDIVLGIPVIKQLGIIEFDFFNNTMSFSQKTETVNQRNIYIEKSNLYINVEICNENLLNYFDTGGEMGLIINTDFYEKNKECIHIEEQALKSGIFYGSCNKASFNHRNEYNCPQIDIKINDKVITMIDDCSVPKDRRSDNQLGAKQGGFMGNAIFKYCKKAKFDFINMIFSVEQ